MRPHILPLAIAALLSSTARADTDLGKATITEESKTVSRGIIVIDAPPAEVYAVITDYASWRKYLTDIEGVKIQSGGRRDAAVRMKSRALGHEATIKFDNQADKRIHFKLVDGPPGARAQGDYVLIGIDGGKRTRVEARLYMDVVGAVGLLVSNKKIRTMRQGKLRADLDDVARWIRIQHRSAA